MAIACPQCGRDDMIQKVSAIYSAGISAGSFMGPTVGITDSPGQGGDAFVGGYMMLRGATQTALSTRLAPPPQPRKGDPTTVPALLLLSAWIATIFIGTISAGTIWIIIFVVVTLSVLAGLFYLIGPVKAKAHGKWMAEMAVWQKAISNWDKLYYCARNDCVFAPTTGESVPADRMYELLYR